MISWCDPELIEKAEWDSQYAEPIMAGATRLGGRGVCRLWTALPGMSGAAVL